MDAAAAAVLSTFTPSMAVPNGHPAACQLQARHYAVRCQRNCPTGQCHTAARLASPRHGMPLLLWNVHDGQHPIHSRRALGFFKQCSPTTHLSRADRPHLLGAYSPPRYSISAGMTPVKGTGANMLVWLRNATPQTLLSSGESPRRPTIALYRGTQGQLVHTVLFGKQPRSCAPLRVCTHTMPLFPQNCHRTRYTTQRGPPDAAMAQQCAAHSPPAPSTHTPKGPPLSLSYTSSFLPSIGLGPSTAACQRYAHATPHPSRARCHHNPAALDTTVVPM